MFIVPKVNRKVGCMGFIPGVQIIFGFSKGGGDKDPENGNEKHKNGT